MSSPKFETYKLGDWHLQCTATIPDAYIAYKTFGNAKSPAIVYPTWYSGCNRKSHSSLQDPFYSCIPSDIRQCLVGWRGQNAQPKECRYSSPRSSLAYAVARSYQHQVLHHHPRPLRQRGVLLPFKPRNLKEFPQSLLLRQRPSTVRARNQTP